MCTVLRTQATTTDPFVNAIGICEGSTALSSQSRTIDAALGDQLVRKDSTGERNEGAR